ncbi:MATE family efflux transporter [Oscillospiraceae bacterium OttesenSCG-928-F05]|nr:MATE family efflux transporter [Oscillospiraceae bacterium OttesenSCG-928-F05]
MVREKSFYKSLFKIALPAAFQSLISLLVVLIDNIMVTSLDPQGVTLAAVSQSNALTTFYTAIIMGLTSGSSVLIAQYWGKRDTARIKQIFSIVLILCLSITLIVVTLISLFPRFFLQATVSGGSADMMQIAVDYFSLLCLSYIPFALSAPLVGMLRSVEVVNVTLFTSAASLATNAFFNYVLIFGHMGFPAMGVRGAAIATILARVLECVIVWIYTFKIQKNLTIRLKDLLKSERWLWADYVRYGLPVGIGDTQWALIGFLKAAIVKYMGPVYISANAITTDILNLGWVFTSALAGGACVVIGKTVGTGDYAKTRQYSNTIQILFACIGIVIAGAMILFRGAFIGIYGIENPEVIHLAGTIIFIGALTTIGTSYHAACFIGINRGAGDSRFVMVVDMICGWLVILPACFLAAFVFKSPPAVFFLCTRIDQCFKWLIAFLRLRGNRWIRNVTRGESPA